ncbi:MAG: HK97 family phage prohead protease [Synergistaceae bacterium]|jgi:HK97 family phage prohead protease|nr:HK97 family phage prohead protease [Synergistaceae bacterium]
MKIQTKQNLEFPFEVKELTDAGTFRGYGSVFDVVDAWDDVVLKGAFTKSLAKKKPALLWQHDSGKPIGVYTSMEEDNRGLKLEGRLLIDAVAQAKEAHALLQAGAINGLSIGYIPLAWEYETRKEKRVRVLKEIDLWETSLVTFPANPKAIVGSVKSMDMKSIRDVEDCLRDAGLGRSEAKAVIAAVRGLTLRDAEEAEALKAARALLKKIKGSESA